MVYEPNPNYTENISFANPTHQQGPSDRVAQPYHDSQSQDTGQLGLLLQGAGALPFNVNLKVPVLH